MPIVSVELQKQTGPSQKPAARPERRQKGRARVSREMLIRAADFNDGSFEEVCNTLNFSRDGLYFFTPHDRYSVGMRLRVSPANQMGAEGDWENPGKVVRVHRQGAGFGVAVVLSDQAASGAQGSSVSAKDRERRAAARAHFVASTEIIDVNTGERCKVRTADLSTQGCYIDTLNPLPVASTVRLQIEKEDEAVEFRAKVVSSHIGSGMGLIFEGMTAEQRSMLTKWLRGKSAPMIVSSKPLPKQQQVTESKVQLTEGQLFLRLLNVLHRKGILNESEVRSLLHDL